MSAMTFQQMADRVAELLEDRLGARGKGLEAKLTRAGHRLPRKVRAAAAEVAQAAVMAQNPKLLLQIDHGAIARAYDSCLQHLNSLKPFARWRDGLFGLVTRIAFALLFTALLALAVLYWRGFI